MAKGHWRNWTTSASIQNVLGEGALTAEEIREKTGYSMNTIRRHLKSLVQSNYVIKLGKRPALYQLKSLTLLT